MTTNQGLPFTFSVAGTPRPQPRPRFVGGRAVSTAEPKAKLWRLAVDRAVRAALANTQASLPLFRGAVRLRCVFTFKPPPGKQDRLGSPHTHKPDASNLLKLIEDVMEDAAVFANDSAVSAPAPEKWWGSQPGVVVIVESAADERRAEPIAAASSSPPDWLLSGLGLAD